MPRSLTTLWRTLLLCSLAYWLGGTLFYITVVIHTAHRVLGSQREFGFVTRQVTNQLNLIALPVLALLLLDALAPLRRRRPVSASPPLPLSPSPRLLPLLTWLPLAALTAALIALHPRIDRHLDPAAMRVLDRRVFKSLHNLYMALTTAQIGAGLAHAWAALSASCARDSQPPTTPSAANRLSE